MPKKGDIHVDQAMTNLAISYRNPGFIADQVMPIVPVKKESDKYFKFSKEELRNIESLRAIGAKSHEVNWDVTSETYSAEEYALSMLVADRIVNNSDMPVRPRITTTKKLVDWLRLGYEKRVQKIAQDTANVTGSAAASPKWDGTSPTIETDVDTAKKSVRQNAGVMANRILLSADVKDVVKKDSTVRNLIRYTMPAAAGLLTSGELPPVLWNLKTVIGNSIENTATEGQTNVIADVWNDNVLVYYVEANLAIDVLTYGYTLRVKQKGKLDILVVTWREDARKGDMLEASMIQDEKVVAEECAYLITDVLS